MLIKLITKFQDAGECLTAVIKETRLVQERIELNKWEISMIWDEIESEQGVYTCEKVGQDLQFNGQLED
jgi:hypothetical protein